jgi:FkbM family methyltransferase
MNQSAIVGDGASNARGDHNSLREHLRRGVQDMRVGLARACLAACDTNATRRYHECALYTRGLVRVRVAGESAHFHVRNPRDYSHLVGEWFERPQLATFLARLRPDDVIYEVGGHIGSWTLFIARRVPRGRVCVFEPEPGNRARLCDNVTLNGLKNVTVCAPALSDETGTARFGQCGAPSEGRHSLIVGQVHQQVLEVPTIRLDDAPRALGLPEPTVVKIDCEGAELAVLAGAARTLASGNVRTIFVEAHGVQLGAIGRRPDEVLAVLSAAGYVPTHTWRRQEETISIVERESAR